MYIRMAALIFLVASLLVAPCSAQLLVDKAGFNWDFSAGGSVDDGTQDAFDGAFVLYVNSESLSGSNGVERNGMLVFGPEVKSNVHVTRHVVLLEDPPGVVYADKFENRTNAKTNVAAMLHSDFGDTAVPQLKSNADGKMYSLSYNHAQPRPTIVCVFGEKDSTFLPTNSGSGDNYSFQFPSLELEAGESKTICYFVAQRSQVDGLKLFENEDVYGNAVNLMSTLGEFNFTSFSGARLYQTFGFTIRPQGTSDFISTRKKDEVFGKLLTKEFELKTEVGTRNYLANEIVMIGKSGDGKFKIAGSDGSLLEGELSPSQVKFELSDGIAGEIKTSEIDSLSTRKFLPATSADAKSEKPTKKVAKKFKKKRNASQWFEFQKPIFMFTSQERLTGQLNKETFKIQSDIGELEIPVEIIQSVEFGKSGSDRQPRFITKDGQAFSGLIHDDFEVEIFDGTIKMVSPKSLTAIYLAEPSAKSMRIGTDQAYLQLGRRDKLIAKLLADQKPIEFKTSFGNRAINPVQIKRLESKSGLTEQMQIELWDGSKLTGQLTSETIRMELLGRPVEIPGTNVKTFVNPMAMPPDALKEKYIKLIGQLNSKKYGERSAAAQTLEKEKTKIYGLLRSQLEHVDVETKARIYKLLPKSDQPKKEAKRTPSG